MGSYEKGGYSLGNNYIDPSDMGAKHLKQRKDDFYQAQYPGNSAQWMQGAIDLRFKAGDQSLYQMFPGNNSYQQTYRLFFNLCRRQINMTVGYQRKNRKSITTLPIHENDDPLADDYNKILRWCDDRDGYQEYQSQAFESSCTVGMSLLHLYPDYTFDPISGDLFTDCVTFQNYIIDQYFRKQDLSDCNGIYRRRWVSQTQAQALLPGYEKEISKMRPSGMKDGRFPLQAELLNIPLNKLFTYDEFYYRTTREATMIIDPHTSEAVEWEQEEDDEDDMMHRALQMQPWLVAKKVQVPTVKLCISLGDKMVYDGPNHLNIDDYPFAPSICYYEPDMQSYAWRNMGMIRNMRDVNFLYNMRKCIELAMLQSQITSGWIYEVDSVTDVKALRQTGEGFLVPIKKGSSIDSIRRIDPPNLPQSLLELSQALSEDISRISGVNEELLGSATDDKSGILSMLRQGAGLTTLQTIFDKLDYTQRIYGKIRLQAIRKNFSKAKVRNILGHDPDPRFFSSYSQKYGVSVEEGNYSATQRQTELMQLLHFKEMGIPIANKSIVRAAIISNKKQVMEDMEEEMQSQSQAQQQEAQTAQKESDAKVMAQIAKAKSDLASADEKRAKIDDIEAGAEHKRTQADYEIVKMMIELEDMDLQNFKNNLELAEYIKLKREKDQANQLQMSNAG
jgi:hypothetical protein